MRMKLAVLLVVVVLTAIVTWNLHPSPEPEFKYVEVPRQALIDIEPKIELGWFEQLWRRQLDLEQRALARAGARDEVFEFCRPLVEHDPASPVDSIPTVSEPDLRAALLSFKITDPWNPWAPRRVELFGMLNSGDRFRDLYKPGPSGRLEGGVDGGKTFLQDNRLGFVQPTVTHGAAFTLGVIIARLIF